MTPRALSKTAGLSYLIIFVTAIFANFFVIESLITAPLDTVQHHQLMVRFGILAFMFTIVFDIVVAWALYKLYAQHALSGLSTLFRMMHAAIMGVAIFALPFTLTATTNEKVLEQVEVFNVTWLIALFFFGIHLILLAKIVGKPKIIAVFLVIAGIMYMVDTSAHFLLANYDAYSSVFLMLVAIPSVLGEMSLAIWLLIKGGR